MNFSDAVAEVIAITVRPDRIEEAKSAINWAISYCCLKSNFAQDLAEGTLIIDPHFYGDTIDFSAQVTRFRKFKYIKPTGVKKYLRPIGSDQIFVPASYMQKDVYYVAGMNITYVLSALHPSLEIGYYQYPQILDGVTHTDHFLLDITPWAIIDLACARVFRSIGDSESFREYQTMGDELFKVARRDFEDSIRVGAT